MTTPVHPPRRIGRPPGADARETLTRILTAARHAFGQKGYTGTTLKDVAAGADITSGALYHYVSSKQHVFEETLVDTWRIIDEILVPEMQRADGFASAMRAYVRAAGRLNAQDPDLGRFVTVARDAAATNPELSGSIETSLLHPRRQALRRIVLQGRRSGELSKDLPADAVVRVLESALDGLARSGARSPSPKVHAETLRAFEALLSGTLVTRTGRRG